MSKEVAIVAIIQPAEGKLDRVRKMDGCLTSYIIGADRWFDLQIKELLNDALSWMQANESGTLEFSVYEERTDKGVSLSLVERWFSTCLA